MPAVKYWICADGWLMDIDDFVFVRDAERQGGCDIQVPYFFWNASLKYQKHEFYRRVWGFDLRDLHVAMPSESYKHSIFKFYDKVRKEDVAIELRCTQLYKWQDIIGIKYNQIFIGDTVKSYETLFSDERGVGAFYHIDGLTMDSGQARGIDKRYPHGLTPKQFHVKYQGRMLNGTSYVLFCGPYGVLLDDDLSFDSFALFDGANNDYVTVDRFVYTVNPYVMKLMMLR